MKYDTAQPYIASYVIIRKDGKVPFVLRAHTGWMDNYYGLASGKVEVGENYTAAAVREVKEEIGITIKPGNLKLLLVCHRQEPGETISWVDMVFEASAWEGEVINAEPHKHSAVEWLSLEHLPENVIPSVRFMMGEIAKGSSYCEYGWKDIEKTGVRL